MVLGAGWGLTLPLAKIAVSEGYRHLGIIFWQLVITGVLLWAISAWRRRPVPLGAPQARRFLAVALVGTVLPGIASYQAAVHLPAGVLSILLSTVPMFAFPIAILLGTDAFRWPRAAGLGFGLAGVWILAGPEALPEPAAAVWIPVALLASACYGIEGNIVARWGRAGMDPVQLLAGASAVGAAVALPLALATGTWIDPRPPWGAPDAAILGSSLVHALVYAGYVWLVGRAGATFAAQVAYLVTGFGVLWSMAMLGESYSGRIWLSLAAMFAGLALVQPRAPAPLVPARQAGKDAR